MATDDENDSPAETEVAVLPRETWEFVKGLLEVFEEALQEASQLSKAPRDDAHRVAALKQLEAVIDLIRALYPENSGLVGPLLETYEALLGIQKGTKANPLITPKISRGSRPNKPEVERFQGEAAAAMELLMRAGDDKDKAARKVARRVLALDFDFESLGYTKTFRTGITRHTIKGWRDKFNDTVDSSLGAMRFHAVLSLVEDREPVNAANWVLRSLLGSMLSKNRDRPQA